jgi:hypothetical protein
VVAWCAGNHLDAVLFAGFWAVIISGILILNNGFGWLQYWWAWAILVPGIFWIYRSILSGDCAAGADWVAQGRRWVKVYELIEVSYHSRIGGARLRLRDADGNRMSIKIEVLHANRTIWDLVYNGILHSVIAGGARTNNRLHLDVHVPHPASGAED